MLVIGIILIFVALVGMLISITYTDPLIMILSIISIIAIIVGGWIIQSGFNESKKINIPKNEITITNIVYEVSNVSESNAIIISNKYEMITITRFPQQ